MNANDPNCKRHPEVCGNVADRSDPNSPVCQLPNDHGGPCDYDTSFWKAIQKEVESKGIKQPSRYFDRKGKPIEWWQYMELFSDPNYQSVAQSDVGRVHVSTVWLGLYPHRRGESIRHLRIFETMVTYPGGRTEIEQHDTEEEALLFHAKKVEELKYIIANTL